MWCALPIIRSRMVLPGRHFWLSHQWSPPQSKQAACCFVVAKFITTWLLWLIKLIWGILVVVLMQLLYKIIQLLYRVNSRLIHLLYQ